MNDENLEISQDKPDLKPSTPAPKEKISYILGVAVLFLAAIAGYWVLSKKLPEITKDTVRPASVSASTFAVYKEIPVNIDPKVPAYAVKSDFGNVENGADFKFSDAAKNLLAKNSFVVIPRYSHKEFFPIYEGNRYDYTPSFITVDSMLHNYHLVFDFLLRKLEEEELASELKILNEQMLSEAVDRYENLKNTEWETAARRNVGFFAVGSKLLDPSVNIPALVKKEVDQELTLVEAHRGISESPVMNIGGELGDVYSTPQGALGTEALKEDYSQYVPRGHYDKTEQLKAYFKSMMWYGRLTFRLKSDDEIKSGILITLALNKEKNKSSWDKIYEPVNFFVGKSDDITYYHFRDLAEKIYGSGAEAVSVAGDKDKFASFVEEAKKLDPPQLNSIPIFNSDIQPDRERETKGFRFMGQRFTIDASIFQRLIEREVKDRMLPKGLDIPAAFGSDEALGILAQAGETKYPNYSQNMEKLRSHISNLSANDWTQNLYWGWMHTLRPLTQVKKEGYPSFMQNIAWVRKELNTFLASWTELKHDTILYAKQVYAELGGGGDIPVKDDRGYVEPNPHVYARLASLLRMTSEGLEARGLLSLALTENLAKIEELALSLKAIAEKELNGEKLTEGEYELIRSYGGQLEHFWLEVNKDEPTFQETKSPREYLNENPAALVADVATDPNGRVLEEGTGWISEIFVVVPVDGKLKIAKGGVYSYYEFEQPLSERLTDKKWRELLSSSQPPALPSWTGEFMAE